MFPTSSTSITGILVRKSESWPPPPDLLNQILQFDTVPRRVTSSFRFKKPCSEGINSSSLTSSSTLGREEGPRQGSNNTPQSLFSSRRLQALESRLAEAEARWRARGTAGAGALVLPSHLVHSHVQSTALGNDSSRRPTTMQSGGNQE